MCQTWITASPLHGDAGVVYLSSIVDDTERMGTVHVYIWGRSAKGKPEEVRSAATSLMKGENLDRLICEIDVSNKRAIKLAQKVGFNIIGTIRQRKDPSGRQYDAILMDALPGDL
jgi:RimJ/RimL family protein N-acetyltransferase